MILVILAALIGSVLAVIPDDSIGDYGVAGTVAVVLLLSMIAIFQQYYLPERIRQTHRMKAKLRISKKIDAEFSEFIGRISKDSVRIDLTRQEISLAPEPLEKSIPQLVSQKNFANLGKDRIDCLVVLWLAYLWKRSVEKTGTDDFKAFENLSSAIRAYFPSMRYSPKLTCLLVAYHRIRPNWRATGEKKPLQALFRGRLPAKMHRNLVFDFCTEMGQQHMFEGLRADQSETLRASLIRLISEGRLSSFGLKKEVIDRIQRKMREYGSGSDVYIILKNKQYDLERHLESLPHLKGKSPMMPSGFSMGGSTKLYQIMVKVPRHYRDTSAFIEAEIRPHLSGDEGFVAVIPVDLLDAKLLPDQRDFSEKGYIATNYGLVNYLLTGFETPDLDIWWLLAKHEVPLKEILTILPLTSIAGSYSPEVASEIWRFNDKIKSHFRIQTLEDWAEVDGDSLGLYLSNISPALADIDVDVLQTKCREMIDEVRSIRASLYPTQMWFTD